MSIATSPPPISEFKCLKPSDGIGAMFVIGCSVATGVAIYLSTVDHWSFWLVGQMLLAFAMLQWFVLIHEAGHKTLFKSAIGNKLSGHFASLLAGIPLVAGFLAAYLTRLPQLRTLLKVLVVSAFLQVLLGFFRGLFVTPLGHQLPDGGNASVAAHLVDLLQQLIAVAPVDGCVRYQPPRTARRIMLSIGVAHATQHQVSLCLLF